MPRGPHFYVRAGAAILFVIRTVTALAAQQPTEAPTTTLRVAIADSNTDLPIEGALVQVVGLAGNVHSDALGRAQFNNVVVGVVRVHVRAFGYGPFDGLLTATQAAPGDSSGTLIELSRNPPTLQAVQIEAKRLEWVDGGGFETRRRLGIGHFLTEQDLERDRGLSIADLIASHATGVVSSGGGVYSTRGVGRCPLDVYVDGLHQSQAFKLADVDPLEVAAIEVYSATNIPPQFNTPANGYSSGRPSCGVLVIWYRR